MEISKSRRIASIGRKAIKEIPDLSYIRDSNIRIAYLSSWDEKRKNGKIVYADCKKVSPLYQWTCPYDFMITVYEPNVADFDDQQMQILIWHELRHVGINTDGNEDSFYTVPHDIEEFRSIIDAFGIDWSESNAKRR